MTWATKDTNKKLELVPDKDPTYGGLVPPKPAEPSGGIGGEFTFDGPAIEEAADELGRRAAISAMETIDPTVWPYTSSSSSPTYKYPWEHSEVDELRKDIANLRREIYELREVFRRATRPEFMMYGGSTSPYPDTLPTSELRLPYKTYVGGWDGGKP